MINVTIDKGEEVQDVKYPCVGVSYPITVLFGDNRYATVLVGGLYEGDDLEVGRVVADFNPKHFRLYKADILITLVEELGL